MCLKSLTLRILRGLSSIIHEKGFELLLARGAHSKKKVDIATAVYSIIQGAQNFKQWFLVGSGGCFQGASDNVWRHFQLSQLVTDATDV